MIGAALRAHFESAFGPQGLSCTALMTAGLLAVPAVADTAEDEMLRPARASKGNFLSAYIAGSSRDTEAETSFSARRSRRIPATRSFWNTPSSPSSRTDP